MTTDDLLSAIEQQQAATESDMTLEQVLEPFIRFGKFAEEVYGRKHAADSYVAGTSKCHLTFGDFRALARFVENSKR